MIHVIPIDDLMNHVETVDCQCSPLHLLDGSVSIVIHHAKDCRESRERMGLKSAGWKVISDSACNLNGDC